MNLAPKVALLQDISGYGRCSVMVAVPVLSAMGAQCCPMLTAYLSAHTACPQTEDSVFLDMTDEMIRTGRHWASLGLSFQAIFSGFLGSAEQIGVLRDFIARFGGSGTLVMVDPVMGDDGRPYRTYTPDLCRRMGELAADADIITPNRTEAAILLGEDYADVPSDQAGLARWLERLSLDGRRSVVITGVRGGVDRLGAACLDRESGRVFFAATHEEPGQYPGTGDLFASVLLGALLKGAALSDATQLAVDFVRQSIRRTLELGAPVIEGVQFEALLGALTGWEPPARQPG